MALTKDGNVLKLINKSRQLQDGTIILNDGRAIAADPNMAGFLWQNKSKNVVIWENVHPNINVKKAFLEGASISVEINDFVLLPHRYFIPWLGRIGNKDGEIKGNEFYGNDIHKLMQKIRNKQFNEIKDI